MRTLIDWMRAAGREFRYAGAALMSLTGISYYER